MTKKTIYYWEKVLNQDDFIGSEHIEQFIDKTLLVQKIVSGELEFEKMVNYPIYKARLNRETRLLGTPLNFEGKICFVILGLVLNHDYHKSKFLRDGVLLSYLDKNAQRFLTEISSTETDRIEKIDAEPFYPTCYEPNARYYNGTFISFNDEQGQAFATPMPIMLDGAPGTGKTYVLIEFFRMFRERCLATGTTRPLLYVTKLGALATAAHQLLEDKNINTDQALICNYDQLVAYLDPSILSLTKVSPKFFAEWVISYLKHPSRTAYSSSSPTRLLQEMRLLSAYKLELMQLNKEAYLTLSEKQSLFPSSQREMLWKMYDDYQLELNKLNQWDPVFHKFSLETFRFEAVFVDEGMDLSFAQLLQLFFLSYQNQYIVALDQRQSLYDQRSHRARLLHLMQQCGISMSHVQLKTNYRCRDNILSLANVFTEIKGHLRGGALDKHGSELIKLSDDELNDPGVVEYVGQKDLARLLPLLASKRCAIITHPSAFLQIRSIFNDSPHIFSIEETKGLEFDVVFLVNPFADDSGNWSAINHELGKWMANNAANKATVKSNRPKKDLNIIKGSWILSFNALLASITRARDSLYLFDFNKDKYRHIYQYISQYYKSRVGPFKSAGVETLVASSREEWLEHVSFLLHQGDSFKEQARELFVKYVNVTPGKFELFYQQLMHPEISPIVSIRPCEEQELSIPLEGNLKKKKNKKKKRVHQEPLEPDTALITHQSVSTQIGIKQLIDELQINFNIELLSRWFSRNEISCHDLEQLIAAPHPMTLLEYLLSFDESAQLFYNFLLNPAQKSWLTHFKKTTINGKHSIIHLAAQYNNSLLIELLAKNGVNVHSANQHTQTPLYLALMAGCIASVQVLVAYGAKFDSLCYSPCAFDQEIPCYMAINYSSNKVQNIFLNTPPEPMNLRHDWSRSARERSPLYEKILKKDVSGVKNLLETNSTLINESYGPLINSPLLVATQLNAFEIVSVLLRYNSNPNLSNKQGVTPLLLAVQFGYEDLVELLLNESSYSLNSETMHGCTPLLMAIYCGHIRIVEKLLNHYPVLNIQIASIAEKKPLDLMYFVKKYHNEDVIKKITYEVSLARASFSCIDVSKILDSFKSMKAVANNFNLLELLKTNRKIEVANYSNKFDVISLFEYYLLYKPDAFNQFIDIAAKFLKINKYNLLRQLSKEKFGFDQTVLHLCSIHKLTKHVDFFVSHGANINAYDKLNFTPLYYAYLYECWETIIKLLDLGANATFSLNADENLKPLLSLLIENPTRQHYLHSRDIQKIMLKLLQNDTNRTYMVGAYRPLISAIKCGDLDWVDILVRKGSDINEPDEGGLSPLMLAVYYKHNLILDYLLQKDGIDLYYKSEQYDRTNIFDCAIIIKNIDALRMLIKIDIENRLMLASTTPLINIIIYWGSLDDIDLLLFEIMLKSGANPNETNSKEDTPLLLALKSGNYQLVKLLINHKAEPALNGILFDNAQLEKITNNPAILKCMQRYLKKWNESEVTAAKSEYLDIWANGMGFFQSIDSNEDTLSCPSEFSVY